MEKVRYSVEEVAHLRQAHVLTRRMVVEVGTSHTQGVVEHAVAYLDDWDHIVSLIVIAAADVVELEDFGALELVIEGVEADDLALARAIFLRDIEQGVAQSFQSLLIERLVPVHLLRGCRPARYLQTDDVGIGSLDFLHDLATAPRKRQAAIPHPWEGVMCGVMVHQQIVGQDPHLRLPRVYILL